MSERDAKMAGMLPTATTAPDGRPMLGAAGIGGLLSIVGLEIFGYGHLLPVIAALLVAAAFAIAAVAWISGAKRHDTEITSWDLAGILAFLGFAAAMIVN